MASLSSKCAMNVELYSLGDLSSLLAACSRVRYVPEELLLPLQIRMAATSRSAAPQDAAAPHISDIATHLSRLGVKGARLWEAVGAAGLAHLPTAAFPDIAGLLAAHARVGVANAELFEEALGRVVSKLRSAQPQDVVTLMWALARSGHSCSRALVRSLTSHLTTRSAEYDVTQLATLAGACGKMGVTDRELRGRLVARAAEALRNETRSLSALLALAPALRRRPDGVAAVQPVTSQAVSTLVAGCGAMGPPDMALLRAAAGLLREMAERGDASAVASRAVAPVEAEHAEEVATALQRAGDMEEAGLLRQACLRHHEQAK